MNKLFLAISFQLVFISAKSQIVQFKCYLKSSCDTVIRELDNYILKKKDFAHFSLNSGITATIPDTGIYILTSPKIVDDSIVICISKFGLNTDTIKQRELFSVLLIDSKPGKIKNGDWLYCGKLSNGYKIDYYNNGNKYLEGNFKRGKPVGELKFYSESGKLEYIEYYSRRGRKIKSEYVKS